MQSKLITEIAEACGIDAVHLIPYGRDKAKVALDAKGSKGEPAKLVLISAITPTDAGEGKTTIAIGLAQGLAHIGKRACLALREPSLGPTFGAKGGATGGGMARVVPADDINLHFTGDFHAVTSAHNLLAAMLDNHIHHGNRLGIDSRRVLWRRVIDMTDRSLRHCVIGLGGTLQGVPREDGFDITPASEVMAAVCLAESYDDLQTRLSKIIVAFTYDGEPVTALDLKAVGAMMVLLKDALLPNLVQTCDGVPAFVHGGPFANIAHGCNSVLATKMAMAHSDWTVTEAGFGFDLGAEKFFDIKCVSAGLDTAAVVLVATVRALKLHGGLTKNELIAANPRAVEAGLPNLQKHLESIKLFGECPVVCINRFETDDKEELKVIKRFCEDSSVHCAVADVFAQGAKGGAELAETVVACAEPSSSRYRPLYDWNEPVRTKMEKIAGAMYGASAVEWSPAAEKDLRQISKLGFDGLPLCVAKTQKSLSEDPSLVGRPDGFDVEVQSVAIAAGAGYLVPFLGDIQRMPGLPSSPQAERMEFVEGKVVGIDH